MVHERGDNPSRIKILSKNGHTKDDLWRVLHHRYKDRLFANIEYYFYPQTHVHCEGPCTVKNTNCFLHILALYLFLFVPRQYLPIANCSKEDFCLPLRVHNYLQTEVLQANLQPTLGHCFDKLWEKVPPNIFGD